MLRVWPPSPVIEVVGLSVDLFALGLLCHHLLLVSPPGEAALQVHSSRAAGLSIITPQGINNCQSDLLLCMTFVFDYDYMIEASLSIQ
jgi:hypothetical protein